MIKKNLNNVLPQVTFSQYWWLNVLTLSHKGTIEPTNQESNYCYCLQLFMNFNCTLYESNQKNWFFLSE